MMSKHVNTLVLSSLEQDESVQVVTKNTFLYFQSKARSHNRSARHRSLTDTALLKDYSDSEAWDWDCETVEGSCAASDSSAEPWDSDGETHGNVRLSNASSTACELGSAIDSAKLLEKNATHGTFRKQQRQCTTIQSHEYTTVMLRNLPNNYTRDMLIELLNSKGFRGEFDFVYLPVDFEKRSGLGYAFVNFASSNDARSAINVLEGFDDWKVPSQKVLQLSWSLPLQGLSANVERYRNSAVMHPDVPQQFKPVVLEKGTPVTFPAPTRNIVGIRSLMVGSCGRFIVPPAQPQTWRQEEQLQHNARKKQQRSLASPEVQPGDYTTVMLRHLPNDYTREMLVELLESKGFGQRFDFVYVPIDFERNSGLGYAFVNFVRPGDAQEAMRTLENFDDWKVPSQKVLYLSWSNPLQGLTANVERYRNNSVMHPSVPDQFRPMIFKDGNPVCFPPPSRNIHPPQRRK